MATNLHRRAILDNCSLRFLLDPEARRVLQRNLQLGQITLCPTYVNVLEATQTRDREVRDTLLGVLRDLAPADVPVLPAPFELFRSVGRAVKAGEQGFTIHSTTVDRMLADPRAAARQRQRAELYLKNITTAFDALHAGLEAKVKRSMREVGIKNKWGHTREFLDQVWRTGDLPTHFAKVLWTGLRMKGPAPVDALLKNETWRMWLDVEGAGVFERGVAWRKPMRTHRTDWLQIPYLGTAAQRILITNDEPFFESATQILAAYPNVRVMRVQELLT